MPKVKLIHIGNNEWVPPIADYRSCEHPRDRLRFDPRFGLPISMYCMACGKAFLHPFHGLTEEEIEARKERVKEQYGWMFEQEEEA